MPKTTSRPTPDDLADTRRAWLSVVRAYNLCTNALSTRLAAMDLHLSEHEVLVNLAHTPHMTQQELAARCFVAKSGISMLLKRMEAQGLVAREPDEADGRIKRLALTPAGTRLATRVRAIQTEVVTAMGQGMSPEETALVTDVMDRVSAQLVALG
ncbi:MAG: MarR family winged helix-turn-helix transcriptional regulator [Ramlibacter sp.]|nr:MarR family transcriptional regulator [Ramlibacter sp.]